jgi:hypothetical protein
MSGDSHVLWRIDSIDLHVTSSQGYKILCISLLVGENLCEVFHIDSFTWFVGFRFTDNSLNNLKISIRFYLCTVLIGICGIVGHNVCNMGLK